MSKKEQKTVSDREQEKEGKNREEEREKYMSLIYL